MVVLETMVAAAPNTPAVVSAPDEHANVIGDWFTVRRMLLLKFLKNPISRCILRKGRVVILCASKIRRDDEPSAQRLGADSYF